MKTIGPLHSFEFMIAGREFLFASSLNSAALDYFFIINILNFVFIGSSLCNLIIIGSDLKSCNC